MTSYEFEKEVCKDLKHKGWWALNIPKNNAGAQPFDIIAIKGTQILAIDCKLCQRGMLAENRIEDNQQLAFEMIRKRAKCRAGFVVGYKDKMHWIEYAGKRPYRVNEVSATEYDLVTGLEWTVY